MSLGSSGVSFGRLCWSSSFGLKFYSDRDHGYLGVEADDALTIAEQIDI